MTPSLKWASVVAISVIACGAAAMVGVAAWQRASANASGTPSAVDTTGAWATGDRIVFQSTASGPDYGVVASVPLSAPGGERHLSGIPCDRVDASLDSFVCLRTERGIVPAYTGELVANDGQALAEWSLSGIPSRTRLSHDGSLIATTAFVTGHSYASIGFSTETVIRTGRGESLGNLEEFTLVIDGAVTAPVDRNLWGVTFADDDDTFYATAQTGGRTYLVRGDLRDRTLTSLAGGVECPSLSPDGTRIAFKQVVPGTGPVTEWSPAVLDLATLDITPLAEPRSVDDQIEWLDDETILYGLSRGTGDADVWALPADGTGEPRILIEHAWSPSVVIGR